jgi:protein-S-isoprenylcysteine O-methyltransferase Ste14
LNCLSISRHDCAMQQAHPITGHEAAPWSLITRNRLLHVAANAGVASIFIAGILPWWPSLLAHLPWGTRLFTAMPQGSRPANSLSAWLWTACALVMAALSLTRTTPREARTDYQAVLAVCGMLFLPMLMRPAAASLPLTAAAVISVDLGLLLQISGLVFVQVSRLYLGRRFGLLPANRGLLVCGPFRIVRHPIYAGWLMSILGTSMASPSFRNFVLVLLTIPFLIWRIVLEETLLRHDPEYVAYQERVRWRLVPGIL